MKHMENIHGMVVGMVKRLDLLNTDKRSPLYMVLQYIADYVFDEDDDYLCTLDDMSTCCYELSQVTEYQAIKAGLLKQDLDFLVHACACQMINYSRYSDFDYYTCSYSEYYPFAEYH